MLRLHRFKSAVAFALLLLSNITLAEHGYPRTMAIAIGIPVKYDDPNLQKNLSKADILILGFWPYWKENEKKSARDVVRAIKTLNPEILVGQYTILNEARAADNPDKTSQDIANKLDKEKWWLKGPTGGKVQHTSLFGAWDINFTKFTQPDQNNKRFPEWFAERNYKIFFQRIPELDFWFLDISVPQSPVPLADWSNSGVPQLSNLSTYSKAYRDGHVAYWNAIRALQPNTLLIGNAPDLTSSEYKGQLNGTMLEAAMGLSWSLYQRKGWEAVRQRYYTLIQDTRAPKIVGFNVQGKPNDYQKMRFGLTTCLLNDGYFSYTDPEKGYINMLWFDEFDVDLGKPLESPPEQPWKDGVYRRLFEKGLVIVNPTNRTVDVSLGTIYKKIQGTQDPATNSGLNVQSVTIKAADGIILLNNVDPPTRPTLNIIK